MLWTQGTRCGARLLSEACVKIQLVHVRCTVRPCARILLGARNVQALEVWKILLTGGANAVWRILLGCTTVDRRKNTKELHVILENPPTSELP